MTAPEYPPGRNLLDGRVVVVTAAAGAGIGFAAAKRCVEEGAVVVVSDVHERRLGEAADSLAELAGERPLAVRCDVTVEDDVQGLFAAAIDAHGHIDVLVNNAGLGGEALLVDMADEEWHRVLDITLTGTMRCTRTALRHMTGRGSGAIVNNASVLGWRAQAGQAHYAAAKAGVMALTRSAAVEAARVRGPGELCGAQHRHAPAPGEDQQRGTPGRPRRRRGLRACRRAVEVAT